MNQPLNIIFAGTPEFSVAPLQTLLNSQHHVMAVYTQPDRPAGRGRKLSASPVKNLALAHEIPVYQPQTLRDETAQAQLRALNADIMIVVAYGLILPKAVLDMPKHGCLNIHASLLPRWRGAAPIQRAIESGDVETGVTLMQMDVGLDTGDMLCKKTTPIYADDNAQTLHDRLSALGCEALMDTLTQVQNGELKPQKQDENLVTYAEKLHKAEAQINWSQSAQALVHKIQAFNPWPVAFTQFQDKPLRILHACTALESEDQISEKQAPEKQAAKSMASEKPPGLVIKVTKKGLLIATGTQAIWVTQLQPAGKKPMAAYEFAQSRHLEGHTF